MVKEMRRGLVTTALMVLKMVGVLVVGGCAPPSPAQQEPELAFRVAMEVNSEEVFQVRLGVENTGRARFEGDSSFNGTMEVRHEPGGDLRASAHVVPLRAVELGETVWPLNWRGDLLAGTYELTWGADGYGSTKEEFVIEEKDGRRYFQGQALATPEPTETAMAEAEALVEEAVLDLANRYGVDREEVTVETVEPFEFPDASLGVPEPGRSYAQVLTPGYIILLRWKDELYEYHAAGERVVSVPRDAEGRDDQVSPSSPSSYRKVNVAQTGLTIEVPSDWERLDTEYAWRPEPGSALRMGLNQTVLEPPMEPEAVLLPGDAEIVVSEPVDVGWAGGRRYTLEVFGPAAEDEDGRAAVEAVEEHVLVVLDTDEDRLGLDFYASAPDADDLAELVAAFDHMVETAEWVDTLGDLLPTPDEDTMSDWQIFDDDTYGFEIQIPADWSYKETPTGGTGMPEDWPLERGVVIFPQDWAERFEEKDGPPDPSAPPAVPAMTVEVYVGPLKQFRRAFPEPTREETVEVNGTTAVREVDAVGDDIEVIRYIFEDPESEDVRVVVTDNYSGFPERREEHPEVADLNRLVVATFAFGG